jgi:hypothetical protein
MAAAIFPLKVDGVGKFTFREKTFRDQVRIEADVSQLLGRRVDQMRPDEKDLVVFAQAVAHLSTLTIEAPPGWDLEGIDPLDEDAGERVIMVYGRLMEELARFRATRKSGGAPAGEGA